MSPAAVTVAVTSAVATAAAATEKASTAVLNGWHFGFYETSSGSEMMSRMER